LFCAQFTFYFDTLIILKLSHLFDRYARVAILNFTYWSYSS